MSQRVPRFQSRQLAWLAWLLVPAQVAMGQAPSRTLNVCHVTADGAVRPAPPDKSRSTPTLAKSPKSNGRRQRTQRPTSDPKLNDLALAHVNVAEVDVRGVAPVTPAVKLAASVERRIGLQNRAQTLVSTRPVAQPIASAAGMLDENIVKEITQRKTMFRMCYESARRRGEAPTRADVKWILAANGTVRDVVVVVAQDAQLANCIRLIASRPFAAGGEQDIPVAIPLLFVIAR